MKDYQAVLIGDIAAETRNEILKYCYGNGIRAYVMPKISDIILMGGDEIHVFDTPFLLSKGYSLSFDQRFWKRTVDLFIAVPLTILLSPIMLLVAFAIKCCDGAGFLQAGAVHERQSGIFYFKIPQHGCGCRKVGRSRSCQRA